MSKLIAVDTSQTSGTKPGRIGDVLLVFLCLSVAAGSLYMFYLSLFQRLSSQAEPVGAVTVKYNSVQRRMGDRVLWDRLISTSPLYTGDLVRVSELSAATLHFSGNDIDLDANTLIRVDVKEGRPQIELSAGNLALNTGADGGNISLVVAGKMVEAGPGTVLSAAADEEGMVLQVSEGAVVLSGEGDSGGAQVIEAGMMISMDASGTERLEAAAVMTHPRPNARYLKNEAGPMNIAFTWNRINLEPGETLRLEIAQDRNFSSIIRSASAFDSAEASLGAGLWYYRLRSGDAVLNSGRLNVIEASGPLPLNPAMNSLYRYTTKQPELLFQWTETGEASSYIFEAGDTPEFNPPRLTRQIPGTFFVEDSNFGPGTWFWRVRPVFPHSYEGEAGFSPVAVFSMEQNSDPDAPDTISVILPPAPPAAEPPPPAAVPAPAPPPAPRPASVPAPAPVQPPAPPPLLPEPGNRLPADGRRIGPGELRTMKSIEFRWAAVQGANAYIFTLFHETGSSRRQIVSTGPENRTSWVLDDLNMLDRGRFIWQVEAVSRNRNGAIERHGRIGENLFIMDIPVPEPVRLGETGNLYGN